MFTFISDAGHGWLEVPIDTLYDLDLKPSDFSNYSYVTPTTIYLEEDCDANRFLYAWQKKHGRPTIRETWGGDRSRIRDLPRNDWHCDEIDTIRF